MRNLTVQRRKSFVACLGKMNLYVEDPICPEITIQNVPCRKLGVLKNGEEKTFQIEESAVKIFVIADKTSKAFCCEFFQLSEGNQDVYLSGQNKFNPAAGNPFRFDHNEDPQALELRKKGTKKGAIVLVLAVILGFVIGFASSSGLFRSDPKPETFVAEGMQITLTDDFRKTEAEGQTVVYDSAKAAVFALKEAFDTIEDAKSLTLREYAELVTEANDRSPDSIQTQDGLTWFEYEFYHREKGTTYHYFAYVYKADDAFWLIQFAVYEDNVAELREEITDWAKSVSFA